MQKDWKIATKIKKSFKDKFPEIHPIILQLLYNRGLKTQKTIDEFLLPDYSQDLHNPFIFLDMQKAVNKIYSSIAKNKKILIFGDYDADGITSSAVLFFVLKKIGVKNLTVYMPDRLKQGHGLSEQIVDGFIKDKYDLIITCDCGISNIKEIDMLKKKNIPVIITDHHIEQDNLPDAFAIINPKLSREKYPCKYLAGVGVAFKLAQALLSDKKCKIENNEAVEKWLLDLVAIGTIADYVPLVGENRTLVKYGFIVLNKTANIGLRTLISKTGLQLGNIDTNGINFFIAPRINVASRVKHASIALNLFLAKNELKASDLVKELDELNKSRQGIVDKIFKKMKTQIGDKPKDKILIIFNKDVSAGLLSLISTRLVNCYFRPVILLTQREDDIIGSGRSINGFDLFKILLKNQKYFLDIGGHTTAMGFVLKKIDMYEDFKNQIIKTVNKELSSESIKNKILIDVVIDFQDINWELYDWLVKLEPFGQNNFVPNFLVKNIELKNIQKVGKNNNHCRLIVDSGKKMIYFGSGDKMKDFNPGDNVDIVFQIGVNQWNGRQELQTKVIDLKKSKQ